MDALKTLAKGTDMNLIEILRAAANNGQPVCDYLLTAELTEFETDYISAHCALSGKKVLLETVTKYWAGTVLWSDRDGYVLEDVVYVRDTGAYNDGTSGKWQESEEMPSRRQWISRASVCTVVLR